MTALDFVECFAFGVLAITLVVFATALYVSKD